jgi:hypothetical protein
MESDKKDLTVSTTTKEFILSVKELDEQYDKMYARVERIGGKEYASSLAEKLREPFCKYRNILLEAVYANIKQNIDLNANSI